MLGHIIERCRAIARPRSAIRRAPLLKIPSGHLSLGRRLQVESLEHRALLASLIATAEIAPGPVAEFTEQARSFIESTLDKVMQTQHQAPVSSSIDSTSGLATDGQAVRITNYTVELAPIQVRETAQGRQSATPLTTPLAPFSVQTSGSSQAMPATSPSSQLVFSFLIYTDNTVSLRARLTNPQVVGFAAPSLDALANSRASLVSTSLHSQRFDDLPTNRPTDSFRQELRTSDAQANANESSDQRTDERSSSMATSSQSKSPEPSSTLEKYFGEGLVESACLEMQPSHAVPSTASLPAEDAASRLPTALGSDVAWLTDSLGMIGLEFSPNASHPLSLTARSNTLENASAIYQVFIQSSADAPLATLDNWAPDEQTAAGIELSPFDFSQVDRLQRVSLIILSMASGYMLSLQRRRKTPLADDSQTS